MIEYKVITSFDRLGNENILNSLAKQGWRVVATLDVEMSRPQIILERNTDGTD